MNLLSGLDLGLLDAIGLEEAAEVGRVAVGRRLARYGLCRGS
jgi:hypothetical protein